MTSSASTINSSNQNLNQNWEIKLLYDGECPLCLREVNFLQKKDAGRGKVAFVDIASDAYNPEENAGIDFETAMGRNHGILADGTVIKNVEVFRRVYETLGMGWVYAITKLPILGALANFIYGIWADLRLKLTGRPDLQTVIKQRQGRLGCDDESRCRVDL